MHLLHGVQKTGLHSPSRCRWGAGACFSRSSRSFLLCFPVWARPESTVPEKQKRASQFWLQDPPRASGLEGVTRQDTWSPGRSTTLLEQQALGTFT